MSGAQPDLFTLTADTLAAPVERKALSEATETRTGTDRVGLSRPPSIDPGFSGEREPRQPATGAALKDEGIRRVAENHPTLFQRLLREAISISGRSPVHADDVRAYCVANGISLSPSMLGAIFARKGWRKVGEMPSRNPACHAHRSGLYVWEGE